MKYPKYYAFGEMLYKVNSPTNVVRIHTAMCEAVVLYGDYFANTVRTIISNAEEIGPEIFDMELDNVIAKFKLHPSAPHFNEIFKKK